jgi:SagB-type dehydrogenase family enzyme
VSGRWQALVYQDDEEPVWELFHENTKLDAGSALPGHEQSAAWMERVSGSLAYDHHPAVPLPEPAPLDMPLGRAVTGRATAESLTRRTLTLAELTALLECAYGVNRDAESTRARKPLRTVPSAGALYPLELFFHTRATEGLEPGLYHYNPLRRELRQVRAGDHTARLASALLQKQLAVDCSLLIVVCGLFERMVGKYGDRGYRFVLLEAGHVAQNLNLAACGLGLGSIDVGGFFDRRLDSLLGLDGLLQSTLYVVAVGGLADPETTIEPPTQ